MTRLIARYRERRSEAGVTLVELSVTILLLGVVSLFVSGALIGAEKIFRVGDDQTRGLEQVKVGAERLSRDIRDARAVLCNPAGTPAALAASDPNCTFHLQLWVDYNSDYVQQASETVTWQLQPSSSPGHFNMVRTVNGSSMVEAGAMVRQVAFGYDIAPTSSTPPPGAQQTHVVNVNMTYDALYGSGKSSNRTVSFSDRLRNVS